MFPLDTPLLQITDDDNQFLYRATLTLVNDLPPSDVTDQLFGFNTNQFSLSGNGTRTLVVQAIGPFRYITPQSDFIDYLRTIGFTTNDQAPFITRNLSLVVEEFPPGEAPSDPYYLPITVTPVNDRPIFTRSDSARTEAVLDDYLPQETNNYGFNASYLISEEEVQDADRRSPLSTDFVGLAITGTMAPDNLGVWQYWSEGAWLDVSSDLTSCAPLFLSPSQRLRFSPQPSLEKTDGRASIQYRVWDGSSELVECVNDTLEVTAGE